MVKQFPDTFRDTMVATVRGDGVDIPPFFIKTQSKSASYASGRRAPPDTKLTKGMDNEQMSLWLDHLMNYVNEPIILLMDRLSVHYSKSTMQKIKSMRLPDGRGAITMRLLPAKTAFLLSPLDMGAFAAMKTYFYNEELSGHVSEWLRG